MATIAEIVLTIGLCLLCWCVLAPILFYYAYKFYQLRRNPVIFKRHYRIVLAINMMVAIYIIFSRPFRIISATFYGPSDANQCFSSVNSCSVVAIIYNISSSISSHGFTSLLVIRLWFICYHTIYNHHQSRGQWIKCIDPSSVESHENAWIFRIHRTLGDERWTLTRVFIPYYILTMSISLLSNMNTTSVIRFDLVFYVVLIILIIVLWLKTPKYYDVLKTRQEMVFVLKCVGVEVILLAIYAVSESAANEEYETYIRIFASACFAIIHALFALRTTRWVLFSSGLYIPEITRLVKRMTESNEPRERKKSSQLDLLYDTLSVKESLDAFMTHLCDEWCMESLLFVIECWQFKDCIVKYHSDESNATYVHKLTTINTLRLPTNALPQSIIAYDKTLSMSKKVKRMANKYIHDGSEFQLNISFQMKHDVLMLCADEKQLNEMSHEQYYQCFDEILDEILLLMRPSYYRFAKKANKASMEDIPSLALLD
eukprot:821488_1